MGEGKALGKREKKQSWARGSAPWAVRRIRGGGHRKVPQEVPIPLLSRNKKENHLPFPRGKNPPIREAFLSREKIYM